ncbi:hypothetical protein MP228_002266 [Amoeboaphelidium protococcarum]|nr:hypothetical protein MP228_002266 [Amoeboaphelidium protococcarum]
MKYSVIVALIVATSAQFAMAGSPRRPRGDRHFFGDNQGHLSQSPQSGPWQQQENGNDQSGIKQFDSIESSNTVHGYTDAQGTQDQGIDPMDVDVDARGNLDKLGLQRQDFYNDQDAPVDQLQRLNAFSPQRQPDYGDAQAGPSMFGLGSDKQSYGSHDSQSLGGFDTDEEEYPSHLAANTPSKSKGAESGVNFRRKWQRMFRGKQQPKPRPKLRRAARISEDAHMTDDVENFIVSQGQKKEGRSRFGALKSRIFGGQARPQDEPELSSESLNLSFDSGDEYGSVIGADLTFPQNDQQKPPSFKRFA